MNFWQNKLLQGQAIKDGINAVGLSPQMKVRFYAKWANWTLNALGAVGKAEPGDSTVLQAILNAGALPIIQLNWSDWREQGSGSRWTSM